MQLFKKVSVLVIFLLTSGIVKAQFGMGKIEEIEDVQHRKLIVIVEEPRERILKKLTKKKKDAEIKNYRAALDEYNKEMKEVVEKYWPWKSNGIEYKTFHEVEVLKKAKSKDYAVIYCISQEPSSSGAGYTSESGLNWSWDMKEDSEDRDYLDYFTSIVVNVIEDLKRAPVYSTPLPDVFPTKASLVFGMNNCKWYFDYRIRTKKNKEKIKANDMLEQMVHENAPKLKTMTLLMRSDWLDKKVPEASIKNFYPYPYQVVSREKMDEAIMTEQENTAYIIILPLVMSTSRSNSIAYIHYIYNAKTGEMMAYLRPSMGSMMGASMLGFGARAGKKTIEQKNLEKFRDMVDGKEK